MDGVGVALFMGEAALGAAAITGAGVGALASVSFLGLVAAADYPRNMIVKTIARDDVRTSEPCE